MAITVTSEDHVKGGKTVVISCGAGETTLPFFLPPYDIGFCMTPVGGTSKVQYCYSPQSVLQANPSNGKWADFSALTASQTFGTLPTASALRLVCSAGTCSLEVRVP